MKAPLGGEASALALFFQEVSRAQGADDFQAAVISGVTVEVTGRNTPLEPESKNHRIAQLLLRREHGPILNGQAACLQGCLVGSKIGNVSEADAIHK